MIGKIFDKYFNGNKNFITPNVYEYDKKIFNEGIVLIEKSSGMGMFNEEIFGCTTLFLKNNTVQKIDLSEAFYSKDEVENYINNLTEKDVKEAIKYGELKNIEGDNYGI